MNTKPGPVSQKKLSERQRGPNISRLTFGAHVGYALVLDVRHVTEHGEYDETGQETGEEVYGTGQYGVPVAVVVELVVAGQRQKGTETRSQREKHLGCRVYPYLREINKYTTGNQVGSPWGRAVVETAVFRTLVLTSLCHCGVR